MLAGAEFPGFAAEVLGDRMKHTALDNHLAVQLVIPVKFDHARNRDAVQRDAVLRTIYSPSWDEVSRRPLRRIAEHIDANVLQVVRPYGLQVLHGLHGNGEELFDPVVHDRKKRPGDGRPRPTPMAIAGGRAQGHGFHASDRGGSVDPCDARLQ